VSHDLTEIDPRQPISLTRGTCLMIPLERRSATAEL
jgi:hypothetical protein